MGSRATARAQHVASQDLTIQGDRSRLGLRGSASSEFVPTLSKRDESEVIFPQRETQKQEGGEMQTESLALDRLSGDKVSVTLERQLQTPRRLGGVLVANEQVVGPPCTARNGIIGDCRQLIKCVRFFFEIELLRSAPCPLPGGVRGVCCPHILVLREPEVEEDPWQKGCPSNFGPREQINQITAWIDGSNVYGSDDDEGRKLRLLSGGRLRVTRVQGRDLLPLNPSECSDEGRHRYCFSAGDLRCNEQLELTVLHTVWMREHNRVATELSKIQPGWDDEQLYQEARRVVVAELQHITYNEWLPIVLGMKYMQKFSMEPTEQGFIDSYNPQVNPTITNTFSTAAMRFGHSLIAGVIKSFNIFGSETKSVPLTKSQFAPYDLYDNLTLESFVRGLATQKAQAMDADMSAELTDHLFQQDDEKFGLDLVSLNIQRGRDHGLAPYTSWRKLCGLSPVTSWKMLAKIFPQNIVPRLQAIYEKVTDVDLFVGGLLESAEEGILGPTFLCLVGDQFQRLKTGDRFWYENSGEQAFTELQLAELKKVSLARVLCDNAENIRTIQPLAFQTPDVLNRRVACDSGDIPNLNLTQWA